MAKKKIITKNTNKIIKLKVKPMAKSKVKEESKVSKEIKKENEKKAKEAFDSVKKDIESGSIKEGEPWQINKTEVLSADEIHNELVNKNLANKG